MTVCDVKGVALRGEPTEHQTLQFPSAPQDFSNGGNSEVLGNFTHPL